jgi:hypothetical protein
LNTPENNELYGSVVSAAVLRPDFSAAQNGSFPETNRGGGPKTVAGKRRSSLNRLSSGLYSNTLVTRGEDKDEYLRFARAIVADLDVQTPLEMALAERIVSALWRSRRARRYEQAHLNKAYDEADRKREQLERVELELARQERDSEAARRLSNCERLTEKELDHASSALERVYWGFNATPDEFWAAFPERGGASRKHVAQIAETMREIFKPMHASEDPRAFWHWIAQQTAHATDRIQRKRDEAGDEYAKALRQTFLLDPTYGDSPSAERRAGRVLHDAERRLDRQVTQALADFDAARRLRP